MKILVADDDAVSRTLMKRVLEKSGYEVSTAEDGVQALELLLSGGGPRLALLDWMMPGFQGPDICRRVRAERRQAYVYMILLTAKLSGDDIVAGLTAGADDYLTKPCNPEELKARLRCGQRILELEDTLMEANEKLRFRASHDALTGLWNHGAILNRLRSELMRIETDAAHLSVLLADVDHFKQVNDVHGHMVGDELLRHVSSRIVEAVEPVDLVGRYGGEEFLILLRDCGPSQIADRAERIRASVADGAFSSERGPLSVSISLGAVPVTEWNQSLSFEPLLKQADDAMYEAKAGGRNRVVCREPA